VTAIEDQTDMIVLRWSPEPADLHERLKRPAFRRQQAKAMLVAAALFVVGMLQTMNTSSRTIGVIWATAGGTMLLFISLIYRRAVRLRWRSDPLERDPVEYTFDARGVLRRQADFECRWGWARIQGVEESPRAFILRLGDGRPSDGPTLVVAKRGIASPADETRLRTLLSRHTGEMTGPPKDLRRLRHRQDRAV
jgi:hypothetical protein